MKETSITVVIPVHNGADTLERVIAPIVAGLKPRDSILAVNDRSSDDSVPLLKRLGVPVISGTGKPGAAGTRNSGAFKARTSWILFVDSDAVVPEGWRDMLGKRMNGAQAVQGVYSREAAGESAATFYKNYYYFHTFTRRIRGPWIKGCGTFFFAVRADVFNDLGGFDENIAGATIEDADFSERLWARGGRIVIAPEIEVFHLREYTCSGLLGYEWRMMRAKALYILRRDPERGSPSVSVAGAGEMMPVIAGALLAWLPFAGMLLFLAGYGYGFYLAVSGLLLTLAMQAPFVFHSVRDGGLRGLRASFYLLPDLLLVVPSCLAAVIWFLRGKKY